MASIINDAHSQNSSTVTDHVYKDFNMSTRMKDIENDIKKGDVWDIIGDYFEDKHLHQLVRHQVESYNDFIQNQMKKTIEMFNPLVIKSSQDYMKEFKKYRLQVVINFENLSLYRPEIHENNGATKLMFPNDARLRNFTYNSNMTLDLHIEYVILKGDKLDIEERKVVKLPKVKFGKIPIMLKSSICILNQYNFLSPEALDECKMDPGGYFIINGSEKTCLGQEKAADNKIYVFKSKENSKWCFTAEMRCVPYWKVISPKQIYMMISAKPEHFGHTIVVNIPKLKKPIPLFILFRALGVSTDKSICEYIVLNLKDKQNTKFLKFLKGCIYPTHEYIDQADCIQYIKNNVIYTPINMTKEEGERKKIDFTRDILNHDLFPNCKTKREKLLLLGMMTNQLISCFLGFRKPDDRDSYENKRIELTGNLLNNLFRNYFNKVVKDINKQVIREINNGSWKSTEEYTNIINQTNIYKIVKSSTIENGIQRALSTGDFGIKQLNSNKVGVAQVLNRLTYASTLSHLRRVNTPIDKSGKLIEPRKLHNSTWGFLCPAETPEGQSVGVVKNLAYMTCISGHSDANCIYDYIINEVDDVNDDTKSLVHLHDKVKVILNGRWIGVARDPIELYRNLKLKKYKGLIHIYTSITFDINNKCIFVYNDSGRLVRPVFKVKNNKQLITSDMVEKIRRKELRWDDLSLSTKLEESVVEYIDNEEQKFSMIAMSKDKMLSQYHYTHCEIHPSTIFGVLASCIPFPEHNQSPRNTYQCAMGKQAIGVYVSNFQKRMDKTAYILNYPMRPLVETRVMNMLKLNNMSSGNQVIVAIMTHSGFNQEDSILFNKGSIDRGLFHATIYHTEKDEDKKINGDEEIRTKPNKAITKGIKYGNYDKLNAQGVMNENTLIEDKDIIIGKIVTIKNNKNDNNKKIKYEDQSKSYKTHEECYIDKNYINRNGDGYTFCKVRIRSHRKPNIGDKFCIKETAQILTEFGWKSLQEIDVTCEKVATLDNGILKYVYASDKYMFDCEQEELYEIKTQQVHMVCTKEHKLYVQKRDKHDFEFVLAKDAFGKRLKYKKNAMNTYSDIPKMIFGNPGENDFVSYNMNDFLVCLGLFIADGYCDVGQKHKRIVYSFNKERKVKMITSALDNMDVKYNIQPNRVIVGCSNVQFFKYFQSLSVGALNKYLPEFVWELSQEQSRILMDALVSGDGHKSSSNSWCYYTSSEVLSEQIQRLSLHCGWSSMIQHYDDRCAQQKTFLKDGRSICSSHDNYRVSIVRTKNTPQVNHGDVKQQCSHTEQYIKFNGKVGCIEVPKTHLFYYRETKYSPPCWTGNSSRHGQKGTIGQIINEEDMPFTKDGLKPDLIINPHAIPSRMTIAQLKETVLGKLLLELGLYGDGTSFGDLDIKTICKELQKQNFESKGNEILYDGKSGEQIETSIFIGPAFYQRLKHMVSDKQHSRNIGPMVNLTRQPAEGRCRDGGLRFGEMERDATISHGAARFTKERIYDVSDKYSVFVCNMCGLIAPFNEEQKIHYCKMCDNRTNFSYVRLPYSCKLLFQELISMNVVPRMLTNKT
jgi:DNA-directed RNA polymerase II subunit RPB2